DQRRAREMLGRTFRAQRAASLLKADHGERPFRAGVGVFLIQDTRAGQTSGDESGPEHSSGSQTLRRSAQPILGPPRSNPDLRQERMAQARILHARRFGPALRYRRASQARIQRAFRVNKRARPSRAGNDSIETLLAPALQRRFLKKILAWYSRYGR